MPTIGCSYSRKVSDGNYGSEEVSMWIEQDVIDVDGGLTQLLNYLKTKVETTLRGRLHK